MEASQHICAVYREFYQEWRLLSLEDRLVLFPYLQHLREQCVDTFRQLKKRNQKICFRNDEGFFI